MAPSTASAAFSASVKKGSDHGDDSTTTTTTTTTPTTPTTPHGDSHDGSGDPIDGEAVVTGLVSGTACPTLSFLAGPYTLKLTASTTFGGGSTCADVKVGSEFNVSATRQTDGSFLVSRLVLKPETHAPEPIEGEAIVSAVTAGTSCPTLEFTLADRFLVKVSAATTYQGGTCADIKVGTRLHVRGAVAADGSVTAASVNIQGGEGDAHREAVEGDGSVTTLVTGTACPTLKFTIGEFTIAVDASTEYVGGTCADIVVGAKVGVKGATDATKNVTATQIRFKHDS